MLPIDSELSSGDITVISGIEMIKREHSQVHREERIIQNVSPGFYHSSSSEIVGLTVTTSHCTVSSLAVHFDLFLSFCCDFQIFNLCIKYYYLNPVFSSLFSFR